MSTNHAFAIDRIKKEYQQQQIQHRIKYIILYNAIKHCILKVELPHGWQLPSTRYLAAQLSLSRTSVLKAYELLSLEKLIISKAGSGNSVNFQRENVPKINKSDAISSQKYPTLSDKGLSYLKNIKLINRLPDEDLAFRPGLPPLDVFPVNQWKKLLNSYWRHVKSSSLSYSQSTGLTEFKKSVCDYLNISRNIKCNPEQIVITSGSLQSEYLIANTLINKGDTVVVENPLFPNVHSVFRSSEAQLIPISLDEQGMNLTELKSKNLKDLKVIHVTPSNHYPLGIKMTLERRQELLRYASETGSLIIEDDYENEIANYEAAIPTIFSLDKEDRTIYMGTFNRLLHPSIRLGYMIVPQFLMPAVQALQEHSHRFVSPSSQMVMNQFIEKNYLYQHIKTCIKVAKERHALFKDLFKSQVKSMHIQEKPFSSFHLLAFFNQPKSVTEELEIIKQLKQNQITVLSLSKCYIGEQQQTGLIIGYASVRPAVIKKKINTLSKLI